MAAFLFMCAAGFAGYILPTVLARAILQQRGIRSDQMIGKRRAGRLAAAIALTAFGTATFDTLPTSACLCACGACLCMVVACLTDLSARIISVETCVALLTFAVPLQLFTHGVEGLFAAFMAALAVEGACIICGFLAQRLAQDTAFGAGDLRIILPLCIATGVTGTFVGIICCSTASLAVACALRLGNDTDWKHVPMGPGLLFWFAIGVLLCA